MNIKVTTLTFLMASLLVACGDEGPPTTTGPSLSPTPPPAPVTSVISEGSVSDLRQNFYVPIGFRTLAPGDLESIVDWTVASDTLWMYLAEGECREQFAQNECPFGPACECRFLARSETNRPKPRTLAAPGRAPGFHTLVVWNLGPESESISWQVLLTTTMAGASAGSRLLAPPETAQVSPLRKASR